MSCLIVTGTDTGIGKTVASAMLTLSLGGDYWKPVQSGTREGTDTQTIAETTGIERDRYLPEQWVLTEPLSPHRSAEIDGVEIDPDALQLPDRAPGDRPLIIEGAGGLMVPLTRTTLLVDVFARWRAPVVLCARTSLGTINHSLLSIEALERRGIPILGIIFIGDEVKDSEQTIISFCDVKRLGRLPMLPAINAKALMEAFAKNFELSDFGAILSS